MDFLHMLVSAVIVLLVLCKAIRCENECTYSMDITPGQHHQITNPSFPNYYTPGSYCTWNMSTSQGHDIKLTCDHMDLPRVQFSINYWDYLDVTINNNSSFRYSYWDPFTITGSSLKIELISSGRLGGGRFSCDVEAIPDEFLVPAVTEVFPLHPIPETCGCGWSHSTRIVGGTEADINEFPSMAWIMYVPQNSFACGATIIAETVALTAAHCIQFSDPRTYRLIVGDHDFTKSEETSATESLEIRRIIKHPNVPDGIDNKFIMDDIALLVTATIIKFTSRVGPACLPFNIKEEELIGKFVTTTGWGSNQFHGRQVDRLKKINQQIVSDSYCKSIYKEEFKSQKHMCAYVPGTNHATGTTCNGDSGGPLYYYDHENNYYTVVGIVKSGNNCNTEQPNMNTDVHNYLPWILNQLPDVKFCQK